MAPESLTHHRFSLASDVWSYGVLICEVLSYGATPFAGVELGALPELLAGGGRLSQPAACPVRWHRELLAPCWATDPAARPTAGELVGVVMRLASTAPAAEPRDLGAALALLEAEAAGRPSAAAARLAAGRPHTPPVPASRPRRSTQWAAAVAPVRAASGPAALLQHCVYAAPGADDPAAQPLRRPTLFAEPPPPAPMAAAVVPAASPAAAAPAAAAEDDDIDLDAVLLYTHVSAEPATPRAERKGSALSQRRASLEQAGARTVSG